MPIYPPFDRAFRAVALPRLGSGGAAFSPLSLSPALWLFGDLYRDAAGTTPATANNDPVGRALDLSANASHASNDTTAQKPTLLTAAQNGLRALSFDGGDWLDAASTVSLGNRYTLLAVLSSSMSTAGTSGVVTGNSSSNAYAFFLDSKINHRCDGAGLAFAAVTITYSANTPIVVGLTRDDNAVQFWRDGAKLGTAQALGANRGSNFKIDRIGAHGNTLSGYSGKMMAFVAIPSAVSDADMGLLFDYFNDLFAVY